MRMDLQDETGLIGCPSWIHIEPCVSLPTRHLGACWKRFEQALNLGPLFRRHNKQYEPTTDRQRRGHSRYGSNRPLSCWLFLAVVKGSAVD